MHGHCVAAATTLSCRRDAHEEIHSRSSLQILQTRPASLALGQLPWIWWCKQRCWWGGPLLKSPKQFETYFYFNKVSQTSCKLRELYTVVEPLNHVEPVHPYCCKSRFAFLEFKDRTESVCHWPSMIKSARGFQWSEQQCRWMAPCHCSLSGLERAGLSRHFLARFLWGKMGEGSNGGCHYDWNLLESIEISWPTLVIFWNVQSPKEDFGCFWFDDAARLIEDSLPLVPSFVRFALLRVDCDMYSSIVQVPQQKYSPVCHYMHRTAHCMDAENFLNLCIWLVRPGVMLFIWPLVGIVVRNNLCRTEVWIKITVNVNEHNNRWRCIQKCGTDFPLNVTLSAWHLRIWFP